MVIWSVCQPYSLHPEGLLCQWLPWQSLAPHCRHCLSYSWVIVGIAVRIYQMSGRYAGFFFKRNFQSACYVNVCQSSHRLLIVPIAASEVCSVFQCTTGHLGVTLVLEWSLWNFVVMYYFMPCVRHMYCMFVCHARVFVCTTSPHRGLLLLTSVTLYCPLSHLQPLSYR